MNSLISASVGLYKDNKGQHYLQVISSDTDNQWVILISKEEAIEISESEDLSIDPLPNLKDIINKID